MSRSRGTEPRMLALLAVADSQENQQYGPEGNPRLAQQTALLEDLLAGQTTCIQGIIRVGVHHSAYPNLASDAFCSQQLVTNLELVLYVAGLVINPLGTTCACYSAV
jgi:hypothetical protein